MLSWMHFPWKCLCSQEEYSIISYSIICLKMEAMWRIEGLYHGQIHKNMYVQHTYNLLCMIHWLFHFPFFFKRNNFISTSGLLFNGSHHSHKGLCYLTVLLGNMFCYLIPVRVPTVSKASIKTYLYYRVSAGNPCSFEPRNP